MMDIAGQIRQMHNKERKLVPFVKKTYMQRYCHQLLCQNPRMLHVFLDVQVLVLIAWGFYICMKRKTHHHHLLCKGRL